MTGASNISIDNEFVTTMGGLDDRAAAWLRGQGVSEIAIDMWPGPVGVAAIETHPPGLFDFTEHGRSAFIQPVLSGSAFTDIVDLVAWYPDQPHQWWTRCYTGISLGVDHLDHAELLGEPLLLHPTPLDWLRAGGEGVCVLDWKISANALRCIPALVFNDAAFGQWVRQTLAQPSLVVPDIKILMSEAA